MPAIGPATRDQTLDVTTRLRAVVGIGAPAVAQDGRKSSSTANHLLAEAGRKVAT
jgi:hypothetical protein